MSVPSAGQIAWYLNIAATFVLIVRLRLIGLHRIYRAFSWYLLVDLVEQTLLLLAHTQRQAAYVYMGGQTAAMILLVFVVLELNQFALAAQPAMARFGRRMVGTVLAISGIVPALTLFVFPLVGSMAAPGRSPVLYYFYAFERTMDSAVLFFLILVSAFMIWFPVRIPQNVAVYIGGFVAYFLSRWAYVLMMGLRRDLLAPLNLATLSITLVCFLAWIALLRPEEQAASTVTGHRWNPVEMDRLSGQLAAINAKLEKFLGKSRISTHYPSLYS
jgi:hypothetical protein